MMLEQVVMIYFSLTCEAEVGLDEFEVDGFLVDNDEDEDGGDDEEMLKKKKKRKLLYLRAL